MERQTLEKLDQALNNLERLITLITDKGRENMEMQDIQAIEILTMKSINILDEIVPRPLPPTVDDLQNEINSLKQIMGKLKERLERAEKVTDMYQNIG